jgi:hypothetical protein
MLIGQASINLSANILSALLGLLSVFIFTRLFSPHDYGVYLLGVGFASVISTFLAGWFRNLILSGHARNDGTDVRGLVLSGYVICCLAAPAGYGLGRLVGLDAVATAAAVGLAAAIGLFELTQDLVRARLLAITAMRATLVRAAASLALGATIAFLSPTGFLLLISSALACLLAVLIQSRAAWRGTKLKFDGSALFAVAKQGLPLTLSLTLLAISSVTDRFMIANLVGAADAGKYISGLDLVRQTLMMPAISAAAAFFPLAVKIHANQGAAAVRSHLAECVELLLSIRTQFILSSQHRRDYRGQCDPVIRPDQRVRHGWCRLGTSRCRCLRICLCPGSEPPGIPNPDSASPACIDCDRRTDHGIGSGSARSKPAPFRSRRMLRAGFHRPRQLRRLVLAAGHLARPQTPETRPFVL